MSRTENPEVVIAPDEYYQRRLESLQQSFDECSRSGDWLSKGRGIAFFASLGLLLMAVNAEDQATVWYWASGVLFLGFVALVTWHEAVIRRQALIEFRTKINRQQQHRRQRDWDEIRTPDAIVPAEHVALAADLNLFGNGSLFQLLCTAHTTFGVRFLQQWMLNPAEPSEIVRRQQTAVALANQNEFREQLQLQSMILAHSPAGPDRIVQWAEGSTWLARRSWLKWLVRGLTVLSMTLPILWLVGWLPSPWGIYLLGGVIVVNVLVNVLFTGRVHEIFDSVDSKAHDLKAYQKLFELVDSLPTETDKLRQLREKMGDAGASRQTLGQLSRIMAFANLRRSPMFGVLHILIQLVWLLDFHVLDWLESWQTKHGQKPRRWFEAVGELEAICCLAYLHFDNPEWAFPTVSPEQVTVDALQLGHPLLAAKDGVANDVNVGPAGRFLLVTGSNMSGKSTLLRSLGANVVLAQMGAPVCAKQFAMPRLLVATSMRIQDSLNDGVSFFMAELKRLKEIVDMAQRQADSPMTLMFLLDEILQGTNSVERQIAVVKVIGHLVKCRALGAVSTHDLDLAGHAEIKDHCQTVHFRETISAQDGHEVMTFDYKMRQGVATTTNALKLLKLVGLSESSPESF